MKSSIFTYKKDILISILISVVLTFLFISYDVFELIIEFTKHHEEYELDEVALLVLSLPISLLWFSYRRLKEIKHVNENLNTEIEDEVKRKLKQENVIQNYSKNALMGEIITSIAHQWRQPLSCITTVASGAKLQTEFNQLTNEELQKNLDEIINYSNYLSNTIETFRNFTQKNKSLELTNIPKTISEALQIIQSSLDEQFITIENNFEDFKNLKISTLPNELQQCIINVVNNSKDAIASNKIPNGKIKITISKEKDFIKINILDNAGGMSEEYINRIFEPYFTTKHEFQGTGLGLYIVNKIVTESLKGEIHIKNFDSGLLTTIKIPDLKDFN